METWTMEKAKRARKAETPKRPSLCLRSRAPYFYPNQRLNLSQPREGPRKICQGFKPDPGNLAVRHYKGGIDRDRRKGNRNDRRRAMASSSPSSSASAVRA